MECALARVDTSFVSFCDADTYYPPHYLKQCDAMFAKGPADLAAVMAHYLYSDPHGWRAKLRRWLMAVVTTVLSRQAHTGGYGQSFRTAVLRQVGGLSAEHWPFVLEDHEIMQRIFKVGRARYDFNLWCMPSPRRSDRGPVGWNLAERLLYHLVPFTLKDWFFYRFLHGRFAQRGLANAALRQKTW